MTNTPAGWYPDPEDATQSRWWDGARWTENRAAPQPLVTNPYSVQDTELKAPEGTRWNTVWIWLIVFLPYVSIPGLFTINWSSAFDFSNRTGMGSLSLITSPGYILSVTGGLVAYALTVWFAFLDWRELTRRGVPKPFHWAWAFVQNAVYPIGRSVIVRRRTGHGIAPMWVSIALIVLSIIGSIVFAVAIMSAVFSSISDLPGYTSP